MAVSNRRTEQLVTLAKGGDRSALNQLGEVYAERVRRIIRLRIGRELRPKLDSIDVVQEALFSALEGIGGFTYTNEGDFLRWLSRIAQNALRDMLDGLHADKRDIRREVRLEASDTTSGGEFIRVHGPINTATPSAILSNKEDLDRLERAMDRLKPEYREVIVLAKIDGLSYEAIGDRLGKSENAVGHLLSRAMAALADIFSATR
jgi:RNA polymerase sigma-70 factor (ECF subfamily)